MKRILFLLMVMAFAFTTYAQVEVLNEDFSACSLPSGWTTNVDYAYGAPGGNTGIATTCGENQLFKFVCDLGAGDYPGFPLNGSGSDFDGCAAVINDDDAGSGFRGIGYIYTPVMDLSNGGINLHFQYDFNALSSEFRVEAFNGSTWDVLFSLDDDAHGVEDIDITSYNNADFQIRFAHDDTGGSWAWGVAFDNVIVTAISPNNGGGGAAECHLDCPGDMVITLDAGECCWPAQYNARTEGDCTTQYDTILLGTPDPLSGFVAPFDPSGYPEWDPPATGYSPDWTTEWTLNGTASTYGPSMIDLSNLPNSISMECYDQYETCPGNGTEAYWNYTMINFIAPSDGTFSFDWVYHTDDSWGAAYDEFGYMINNTFALNDIYDPFGADDQNGHFSIDLQEGDNIALYVHNNDWYDCGAEVTMSNFSFGFAPVTDGIVVAEGPAPGEEICEGETQTVKLHLLENGVAIDSCSFDITVNEYPNPTTTLVGNDDVVVSLDETGIGIVRTDDVLEGGPYRCYDKYLLTREPAMSGVPGDPASGPNPGFITVNCNDVGNVVMVTVTDPETGVSVMVNVHVVDKIPPTIECECPEGGEFPAGSVVPGSIAGEFTERDLTANLHRDCWDFGTGDQVPDHGNHYYDVYAINVSMDGDYAFDGSDGNKMLIGVFDNPFDVVDVCSNMVAGMGGYVLGSSGLFYEEPTSGGNLSNIASLDAGVTYYVVVSDFDAGYLGGYSFSITGPSGSEVTFAKTVYGGDCEFAGCYEEGTNYDFALPTYNDNCDAELTWTQEVRDGDECGTYIVKRVYTVTDASGMTATCTSEYFFKGIDLSNLTWPANYDGLPNHNPMLECSDIYETDENGNPDPSVTGAPEGYNDACGTIEVFYTDDVRELDCGKKIFRDWRVVDDCSGKILEYTQLIRITDSEAPEVTVPADVRVRTKAYVCGADVVIPAPEVEDNCDGEVLWGATTTAGLIDGDYNGNGLVDDGEVWRLYNVPEGTYELCYYAEDHCGNRSESECIELVVYDGVPPIAACEQYKQVSLTVDGNAVVNAVDFNSGSWDNCGDVYFKVLRVDDNMNYDKGCEELNGDDNPGTPRYQDANGVWRKNEVWYDDDVAFCCEDLNEQRMVSLRVFDVDPGAGPIDPRRYTEAYTLTHNDGLYGRYNDCWTIVQVENKLPPVLDCPDVVVSCGESTDPELNPRLRINMESICDATLEYHDSENDGVCASRITRTWVADDHGRTSTCVQRIFIEGEPFDPLTITFPADLSYDCPSGEKFNEPTFDKLPCNVVTAEYTDDTFKFVDGACYKILREWAVIDWCVYDDLSYEERTAARQNVDVLRGRKLDKNSLVEDGYYRYTQVIMMNDFIDPEIIVNDTCVALNQECYAVNVKLTASATDSCNVTEEFHWKYIVYDADTWEVLQYSKNYQPAPLGGVKGRHDKLGGLKGTVEATMQFDIPLPVGNYVVVWTVGDGCGNAVSKRQYVEVADKKAPTPLMVDIATASMTNGMVELTARWFDKGGCDNGCISSFDNCTPKDGLYFTFTPVLPDIYGPDWRKFRNDFNNYGLYFYNSETGAYASKSQYEAAGNTVIHAFDPINHTAIKRFWCEYLEEGEDRLTIPVYVWDQFAMDEECDDNNYDFANVILTIEHCKSGTASLAGTINNAKDRFDVVLDNGTESVSVRTDENGNYKFTNVSAGDYTVSGSSEENYLRGVSTLDLVLIQKHILGMKKLTDPYKLVAADANKDGRILSSDLLAIKKVLLGKTNKFKNSSWVALSNDYTFSNLDNVLSEVESAKVRNVSVADGSVISGIDFTGVKIGDVSGNVNTIEYRSDNSVKLGVDNQVYGTGSEIEVPVYAENVADIYGMQFTMNMSGIEYAGIESGKLQVSASDVNVVDGKLLFSWSKGEGEKVESGDVLFTMKFKSNRGGSLRSALSMSDQILRREAYVGSDLEIDNVELNFRGGVENALYQNEPNPFADVTVVGFDLAEGGEYTLTVYDVTGKVLAVRSGEGKAGYNSERFTKKELGAKGVLYYRLESGDYTATKKMIVIK